MAIVNSSILWTEVVTEIHTTTFWVPVYDYETSFWYRNDTTSTKLSFEPSLSLWYPIATSAPYYEDGVLKIGNPPKRTEFTLTETTRSIDEGVEVPEVVNGRDGGRDQGRDEDRDGGRDEGHDREGGSVPGREEGNDREGGSEPGREEGREEGEGFISFNSENSSTKSINNTLNTQTIDSLPITPELNSHHYSRPPTYSRNHTRLAPTSSYLRISRQIPPTTAFTPKFDRVPKYTKHFTGVVAHNRSILFNGKASPTTSFNYAIILILAGSVLSFAAIM